MHNQNVFIKYGDSFDDVNLFVIELLSLGLLWHGFHDAVKEGNGDCFGGAGNFIWCCSSLPVTLTILRRQ